MSYKSTLEIAGKKMDVLYCNFKLSRDTDNKGRPSSRVYGGRVNFEIESTEDTSTIEKMVNDQYKPFDGKISYIKGDDESIMKQLEFKKAYIVYYEETLDIKGKDPMKIRCTLSAEELTMGSATQKNEWPKA